MRNNTLLFFIVDPFFLTVRVHACACLCVCVCVQNCLIYGLDTRQTGPNSCQLIPPPSPPPPTAAVGGRGEVLTCCAYSHRTDHNITLVHTAKHSSMAKLAATSKNCMSAGMGGQQKVTAVRLSTFHLFVSDYRGLVTCISGNEGSMLSICRIFYSYFWMYCLIQLC